MYLTNIIKSCAPFNLQITRVLFIFRLQGMPGAPGMKMYSREDLMNNNFADDDADADEDDDDVEAEFPSNLVLRNTLC